MEYKQDMPPPGGYAPITYARVPYKKGWSIHVKGAFALGAVVVGLYFFEQTRNRISNENLEMRCGTVALTPMLTAEADRMALKQLKKNRELEEELMKNNKCWQVGKWKNLPVYLTLGPNDYYKPAFEEYFAHAPHDDWIEARYIRYST